MKVLLAVLLLSAPQDVSIRDLVKGWRFEDPAVRQAATDVILARWQSWTDEDLAVLEAERTSREPEAAAQANFILSRIAVRRGLGAKLLDRYPGIDRAFDGGSEAARFDRIRRASTDWGRRKLEAFDLGKLARAARGGSWNKHALDVIVLCRNDDIRPLGPLIAMFLEHADPEVRSNAADTIGALGLKEYAPDLVPLLTDERDFVHWIAADSMAMLGASDLAVKVAPLLEHRSAGVRGNAVRLLGILGSRSFTRSIAPLLKDEDEEVRLEAVQALGGLGASEYVEGVLPFLDGKKFRQRSLAVRALASMGTRGQRRLLEAVQGKRDGFRELALVAAAFNEAREAAVHRRLDRKKLEPDSPLRTVKDLASAADGAGFRLEYGADALLPGEIPVGTSLSLYQAIERAFPPPSFVVLEGNRILILDARAMIAHWQKKLDGK